MTFDPCFHVLFGACIVKATRIAQVGDLARQRAWEGAAITDTPLLDRLADHAARIRLDAIPQHVVDEAILTIMDTVACIASGSLTPEADAVVASELARGGNGQVAILGRRQRLSTEGAARVNAYMGDIYELNDLTCGHSGIGNVAAVLALAPLVKASGRDLIEALTTGIEITCRIYSTFYPTMKPYTEVGMVSVGPCVSAGSAAACAKLLGLDRDGILNAMAGAMAQAGWCPAEVIFGDGGSVKPLMFGSLPAAAGIAGAFGSRAGLTGPRALLEGPMGYLRSVGKSYDPAPILDGDTWYLASPRRKYHACCGYMHSALDTVISLRREGVDASRVARMDVRMPDYICPAVSKTLPPRTANEARFHSQYCLALALLGEDIILPEHSRDCASLAARPEVTRLIAATEIISEPVFRHYHESRVDLFDTSGTFLARCENTAPKGSSKNPLSPSEVCEKFRRLTTPFQAEMDVEAYIDRLSGLAAEARTGWIIEAFPQVSA